MPPREWLLRIEDILDAAEKIKRFTRGMDATSFAANETVVDAVLHNLSVIGEAAKHVPNDVKTRYADIPWPDMQGMRNVLMHEYFGVTLARVWTTVEVSLPAVVPTLEQILRENRGMADAPRRDEGKSE